MIDLAAVAVGIAVGVCLAAAFRLHRRDAEPLRAPAELRAERERRAPPEEQNAALQQEHAGARGDSGDPVGVVAHPEAPARPTASAPCGSGAPCGRVGSGPSRGQAGDGSSRVRNGWYRRMARTP